MEDCTNITIFARHSVRNYKHQPLSEEQIRVLQHKIDECNTLSNLHIQLVTNETKAFSGPTTTDLNGNMALPGFHDIDTVGQKMAELINDGKNHQGELDRKSVV